jgi:hypothetical protein
MPDDDDEQMHIPAFIRSMLEPYRNIMGPRETPLPKRQLERTLLAEIFRPTEAQLTAIGRVTVAWSVMERVMGMAIARLSLSPEYPLLAVTRDLTSTAQIRILRRLIPLHRDRYRTQIANDNLVAELLKLPRQIETLKDERNVIIHNVWHQGMGSDSIAAMRSKPVGSGSQDDTIKKTLADLNDLAERIQKMADHLFVLIQLLPDVDEEQHAQSLSRSVQTLHDEILPSRPRLPKSSQE